MPETKELREFFAARKHWSAQHDDVRKKQRDGVPLTNKERVNQARFLEARSNVPSWLRHLCS